ncbi:MAG: lysophospholipase [Firmicutes bacterium]|nr:lysophospholipase [Bacillota bacterium]
MPDTKPQPRRKIKKVVIMVAIALAAVYLIGGGVGSCLFYFEKFSRVENADPDTFFSYYTYPDVDKAKYPRSEFTFSSKGNTLVGYEYGAPNTRGLIVISAGLGGTGDEYMTFMTRFVDDGYRVITYNNTGVASSEGGNTRGLYQSAIDLDALLTHLESQKEYGDLPVYLLGHSWGGYAVCAALNQPHRVNASVSMAGYADGMEMFVGAGKELAGNVFYLLYPYLWAIQKCYFGADMDVSAIDGINASDIPFLIIQGEKDELIRPDGASIYAHRDEIKNPKTRYMLTAGDHEWVYSSQAAAAYNQEMTKSYGDFFELPEVKAEIKREAQNRALLEKVWAESVNFDKLLYNEIDEEIILRIETMFDSAK